MEPCDVYTSVALGLVASMASVASPVSISSLLAAELERNPSGAQAAQVARTLRQTLELEPESAEKVPTPCSSYSKGLAKLIMKVECLD